MIREVELNEDCFILSYVDSVLTLDGWKKVLDLKENDIILGQELSNQEQITYIDKKDKNNGGKNLHNTKNLT